MWCPDGYLTLDEIRQRILNLCRKYTYRHYLPGGIDLSRGPEVPPGVVDQTWATSTWLLVDFLRYARWSASSTTGTVVIVQLLSIVRGIEADHRDPEATLWASSYNPLTSIGPPSRAWIDAYANGYFERPSFINLTVGVIRLPSFLTGLRLLSPLIYARGLGRLAAKFRMLDWFAAYWMAVRFRGRALCMKAAEFEGLEKELGKYLDALHGIEVSSTTSSDLKNPRQTKGPGRTKEKRERIASAILQLYGNSERTKSWKQVHRETRDILHDDFSLMSLKRAFADLEEREEREQK